MKNKLLLFVFFLVSFFFGSMIVSARDECYYMIGTSSETTISTFGNFIKFIVEDGTNFNVTYISDSRTVSAASLNFVKDFKDFYKVNYSCPEVLYMATAYYDVTFNVTFEVDHFFIYDNIFDDEYADKFVKFVLSKEPDNSGASEMPDNTCESLFSENLLKKLQEYFDIFKIVVPILVLVLSSLDFAKSVLNNDSDDFRKSQLKFAKRLVLAVVFFLLPILLSFLLKLINSNVSTCGIG